MIAANAVRYLTRNGQDAGARTPGSRYGSTAGECARVAWRFARVTAQDMGREVTLEFLDFCMGLVVNNHDDVACTLGGAW